MSNYIITSEKFNELLKDSLKNVKMNEYVKLKIKPSNDLDLWLNCYKHSFERDNKNASLTLEIIKASNMYLIRYYADIEIHFNEDTSCDNLIVDYEDVDAFLRDYFEFKSESDNEE